jgi:hypothetical protein
MAHGQARRRSAIRRSGQTAIPGKIDTLSLRRTSDRLRASRSPRRTRPVPAGDKRGRTSGDSCSTVSTSPPAISGNVEPGDVLSVSNGTWATIQPAMRTRGRSAKAGTARPSVAPRRVATCLGRWRHHQVGRDGKQRGAEISACSSPTAVVVASNTLSTSAGSRTAVSPRQPLPCPTRP